MPKTLVSYRLTDSTRDLIQEALDMQRQLDQAEGQQWMAASRDRTEIIEKAVAYYHDYLRKRMAALQEEDKPLIARCPSCKATFEYRPKCPSCSKPVKKPVRS